MHRDRFYTLSASCPDQVGIIARVSGFIAGNGGWILESSFHADALTGRYFMRIEIRADSLPFLLAEFRERFRREVAEPLSMTWTINDSAVKKRVVVLVSKDPEVDSVVKVVNLGEGEDDATEQEALADAISALAISACDLTDEAIEDAAEAPDEDETEVDDTDDEPKP